MTTKKLKAAINLAAPLEPAQIAATEESVAIKGTLYIQPNGDQFFEADESKPKDPKKDSSYKLLFSDGVVKHYTTKRKHLFYCTLDQKSTELVGEILPRTIVHFCAAAKVKKVKFYIKDESNV